MSGNDERLEKGMLSDIEVHYGPFLEGTSVMGLPSGVKTTDVLSEVTCRVCLQVLIERGQIEDSE